MQVDFEQVPDLVAGRKVYLRHGQAYVYKTDVASLVVGHFRYVWSRTTDQTVLRHLQQGKSLHL